MNRYVSIIDKCKAQTAGNSGTISKVCNAAVVDYRLIYVFHDTSEAPYSCLDSRSRFCQILKVSSGQNDWNHAITALISSSVNFPSHGGIFPSGIDPSLITSINTSVGWCQAWAVPFNGGGGYFPSASGVFHSFVPSA